VGLVVLAGPALSGKSTLAEHMVRRHRGDVLIDYSRIYSAMTLVPRGQLRPSPVPIPFVQAVREHAIREAGARELSGVITVASGRQVERVATLANGAPVVIVGMTRAEFDKALAAGREAPEPSKAEERATRVTTRTWLQECGSAGRRWYDNEPRPGSGYQLGSFAGGFSVTVRSDNDPLKRALRKMTRYGFRDADVEFTAWLLDRLVELDNPRGRELMATALRLGELLDSGLDAADAAVVAAGAALEEFADAA